MTISEQSRHRLYQRLEEVLGTGEATTLMEHLPPVGWADVATKHDVALLDGRVRELERQMERGFERVEFRFAQMEGRFDGIRSEFRATMLAVMSMMVVLVEAIVAAVKL